MRERVETKCYYVSTNTLTKIKNEKSLPLTMHCRQKSARLAMQDSYRQAKEKNGQSTSNNNDWINNDFKFLFEQEFNELLLSNKSKIRN